MDQDEIEFTLDSPIEWLREELREKSKTEAIDVGDMLEKDGLWRVVVVVVVFPGEDTIIQMMAECSVKDERFGDRITRAKPSKKHTGMT